MSRQFTSEWLASREARMSVKNPERRLTCSPAAERESDLQEAIIAECRRRGWLVFHSRMDTRTTRPLGEPDLTVLMADGRWLLVECKAKSGKLSEAQLGVHAWAKKLGHTIYVVRSLADFHSIL